MYQLRAHFISSNHIGNNEVQCKITSQILHFNKVFRSKNKASIFADKKFKHYIIVAVVTELRGFFSVKHMGLADTLIISNQLRQYNCLKLIIAQHFNNPHVSSINAFITCFIGLLQMLR